MNNQPNVNDLDSPFPVDPESPDVVSFDEQKELQQLREQAQAGQDRALRAVAELDNFRKRVQREQEEFSKYREVSLLTDLLPVVDNLDRAIQAASKSSDASLLQGVNMVSTQLTEVLAKHHCTRIGMVGEPFDPNFHQAIMQQPSADHPENTVLIVAASGYKVYDRTIRPAQVIVSKKPE